MKHNIKNLDEKMDAIFKIARDVKSGKIKPAKSYDSLDAFVADLKS